MKVLVPYNESLFFVCLLTMFVVGLFRDLLKFPFSRLGTKGIVSGKGHVIQGGRKRED